jgi:hypothetical protein
MSVGRQRRSARPPGGRSGSRTLRIVGVAIVLIIITASPVWKSPPTNGISGAIHLSHSSQGARASTAVETATEVSDGTLELTDQTFALSPQFFGVNVHVVGLDASALAALVNSTPFVSFRFSPAGEATNQVLSLTYSPNGVPTPVYAETDAEFVTWCRWVSCQATMMVPAEIDNPSEAAATVRYVEQTLHFHPVYWAIGNEPQQWTHWGIHWAKWRSTDHSTPTAEQYALEVQKYVKAMRAVDPKIRIIGIESVVGGSLGGAWIKDVVAVDGPNLSAIAYHAYPLGSGSGPASLSAFYHALANPTAFPLNYPETVSMVHAACPSCKIMVFVDELNAGLGGSYESYLTSYPEVPFMSAALIMAMREDVRRVMFFDLEDLDGNQPYGLTTVGQGSRPAFLLYSDILHRLAATSVNGTTIVGGPRGVYEVLTTSSSSTSLFVVNTNLTTTLSLALPKTGSVFGSPLTEYRWTYPAGLPAAAVKVSKPSGVNWNVSPQSLLALVWSKG